MEDDVTQGLEEEVVETPQSEPVQEEGTQDPNELLRALDEKYADKISNLEGMLTVRQLKEQRGAKPKPLFDNPDPNNYITEDKLQGYLEQALSPIQKENAIFRIERSEERARRDHEDYDEVFKFADKIFKNDDLARKLGYDNGQDVFDTVMGNKHPAEAAYLLGSLHPEWRQALKEKTMQSANNKESEIVDKTIKNLNRPTLPSGSKFATKSTSADDDPDNWDDARFEKEIAATLQKRPRQE
jgi:hypothetical protein